MARTAEHNEVLDVVVRVCSVTRYKYEEAAALAETNILRWLHGLPEKRKYYDHQPRSLRDL